MSRSAVNNGSTTLKDFVFKKNLFSSHRAAKLCFLFSLSLSAAENNFKMNSSFVLLQVLETTVNKYNQYKKLSCCDVLMAAKLLIISRIKLLIISQPNFECLPNRYQSMKDRFFS